MEKVEEKIVRGLVDHFRMLRLEKGLSHNKLATLAGVTRPAISLIENGKRIPTLIVCLKIAHALDISLGRTIAKYESKLR
ncbi:MAG: helix-turn-helix transcriptional regulator [Alphaproteobacteria bacterium]